ncbi:MAG TPA: type II toxin-antitoxin system RelE/ParE family toxin [Acetobacteraceae bacterium]|nr:type II toxin-antitoxin system RelE/ParE family toxin [Acetobacteraceae bacterium]
MTRVSWTVSALVDLQEIRRYIAEFNPAAAQTLAEQVIEASNSLVIFPRRGRLVGDNLREIMPVFPYLLRYEIVGDAVNILRVRHGMRVQ